ncbi:MAG: glycosyltransferase [Pseudomonadota bacterium]|nr:glycosyltransferase [Pseudomonadota bacterium]
MADHKPGKPLVSVVMNCYNGEAYLGESIRSLMEQSYRNWELIFYDNISSDNSLKIAKNFSDRRIHIHSSKAHLPLSKARKEAINLTKGVWLSFLDTDDLWMPDKLEKQIKEINKKLIEDQPIHLIFGPCEVFSKYSTRAKDNILSGELFSELLSGNYEVNWPTVMFSKEAYIELGGFSDKYELTYDYDFLLRIASEFNYSFLALNLARYRLHGSNLSKFFLEQMLLELIEIVSIYLPSKLASERLLEFKFRYSLFLLKKLKFSEFMTYIKDLSFLGLFKYLFSKLKDLSKYGQ